MTMQLFLKQGNVAVSVMRWEGNTIVLLHYCYFSFKEINTVIQQGCIKLISSDSKIITILYFEKILFF